MVAVMKTLGNLLSTVVGEPPLNDSEDSSVYTAEESKPLPPLPDADLFEPNEEILNDSENEVLNHQPQEPLPQLEDKGQDDKKPTTTLTENVVGNSTRGDVAIVIERQVEVPKSLVDKVNIVFPPLADDIKNVLSATHASNANSTVVDDSLPHGPRVLKSHSPERYTDIPAELSPELKPLQEALTEEVREFGGGYYLHPKKIAEIPPELSHQARSLHDDINKEVVHGAELLHPKELAEIPAELSTEVRQLHEALNREVEYGAYVLHPKQIAEIPADLDSKIVSLHKDLNTEIESGVDVLHAKEIVEIPAELGQDVRELHASLNEEVKQFGDFNHLHPKQIVDIPASLSPEVQKMHEALNEEVIQVGGPKQLRPKPIVEVPAELAPEVRDLVADLNQEVAYVGGPQILHPKTIAEIPADLCEEAKYLHEEINQEVKTFKPCLLHPKQIAEIPAELCPEVREAHENLNNEIKYGGYHLHPKEIAEVPSEVNPEVRSLHDTLAVEVELFGGANRLHEITGSDPSKEPPKELEDSVKELIPALTTEIREFDGPAKLRYYGNPKLNAEYHVVPPKLDIDSFQTHVEQMLQLYGSADSGLDLSTSIKPASDDPVLVECVNSVMNAFIKAAKKLREPLTDKEVLVEELHRRRAIIDVDDKAPAKGQLKDDTANDDENGKSVDEAKRMNGDVQEDSGLFDQSAKETTVPATTDKTDPTEQEAKPTAASPPKTNDGSPDDKKMRKLFRRLSGWRASHATLHDESASEPESPLAKHVPETDKATNGHHNTLPRKRRWNPFRKHHKDQVDNESSAVPVA